MSSRTRKGLTPKLLGLKRLLDHFLLRFYKWYFGYSDKMRIRELNKRGVRRLNNELEEMD